MPDEPQTTSGEEADFRELLRRILNEEESRDALLSNPVFKRRVPSICQNFTRNAADADDLTNFVRAVVCDKLDQFEPKYDMPYWNFFSWVTRIARNKAIDDFRRRSARKEDGQLEELSAVGDAKADVEAEAERREALERFWTFVRNLDKLTQKIMHYHLADYSLRETKEGLAAEGIQLSHVAIGHVVRKVVADFFASENARIAAMIARKGEHESRGRESGGPPARKTGS